MNEDPDGEIEYSGKTFLKSNPELLLHSSDSFWPKLSTSSSLGLSKYAIMKENVKYSKTITWM